MTPPDMDEIVRFNTYRRAMIEALQSATRETMPEAELTVLRWMIEYHRPRGWRRLVKRVKGRPTGNIPQS